MTESGGTPAELQPAPLGGGETLVRYDVLAEIGAGGMATVQYGRLRAPHGFTRSVAIKRLHPQFAKDPEFVNMFIDEARLSARLVHANIVGTLDVIATPDELALVMEYVHGESLWNLLRLAGQYDKPLPVRVATALAASVLYGLQAAHDACDELGEPLGIVHRDVSPHNILVGGDGIPRLIDFGVAKAVGRLRSTPSGEIKGKLIYMSPEQLRAESVDHRADIYGAAAVLWETLTGLSLFDGPSESSIMHGVLNATIEPPSKHRSEVTPELDAIVLRGLSRDPEGRFASAREMALALEHDVGIASQSEISGWLQELAGGRLAERARLITELHERGPAQSERRLFEQGAGAVITGPSSQPKRPASRAWLAAVVLLFASGAYWLYGEARGRRVPVEVKPSTAHAVAPVSTSTSTSAAADPELPRGIEPPPPVSVRSDPPPTAAEAPSRAHTPRPAVREAKPAAARPAPEKAKPDCRIWYVVDASGIRRPKPECL